MSILDFVANHSGVLFALLTTGACAGLLAGLLGVGGGIIIVPVLFFLFQSDDVSPASAMVIATATSLATIVPTSISSIRAHYKKGNVDCPLLVRWGPFILLGVLLGSWLVTWINGTWVIALFGIIATLSALSGLCRSDSPLFEDLPNRVGQAVMASAVGLLQRPSRHWWWHPLGAFADSAPLPSPQGGGYRCCHRINHCTAGRFNDAGTGWHTCRRTGG